MFRNYLTVALRNLVRHKLYSFINIAGLAVGLACAILIILFVRDELSYDAWLPGTDNLYRLEQAVIVPGRPPLPLAVIPYAMPASMKDEIPEVTGMTRFWSEGMTLTAGDRQFVEDVNVVDPGFFTVIPLPLISGNPGQVLSQPDSAVLTLAAARKFFGIDNPIGRTFSTGRGDCEDADMACKNQTVSLRVTGIARDLPYNSQLKDDIFIANTSLADRYSQKMKQNWLSQNGYGYLRLAPGADPQSVIAKTAPILNRTLTSDLRRFGINMKGEMVYQLHLTPFTQVHLNSSRWLYNLTPPGSWTTIYGVAVIGFLILLVACFNFMNLATARAMLRAREIALRKTLGARRGQLILQFLAEAVLMALVSLLLALALVEMILPLFDSFLQRPITFDYVRDWSLLLLILAVAMVAGLVGGSYPALVLSRFRPATVLRTNSAGQSGSGWLRTGLVVLQFSVSIGLGIAALVVFSQISFARNVDLGFNRDHVLIVSGGGRVTGEGRESFSQALRSNPGVVAMATGGLQPFDNGQSMANVTVPGRPETIMLNEIAASPDIPKVYDMHLVAGRLLSDDRAEDRMYRKTFLQPDPRNEGHNILINESAAARLGFTPQEAVGKTVNFGFNHVRIVGVLADAKYGGAREPVKPTAFDYYPEIPMDIVLKLRGDRVAETLSFIDGKWHSFAPNIAVRRHFLDANFDKMFSSDERQGTLFGIFVGIAIVIACLGLFGLAAFTAERRTREIGIRKVFGARTRDVVFLLLWQFSIPVLIANLIAWPLAWYYLQGWLQGFAYRISLNPLYFLAVGGGALIIAWATIFAHALRVARANPINALRYE